jgi:hypothetical protein
MSQILTRKNRWSPGETAARIDLLLTRKKRRDRDTPLGALLNFITKAGHPGLRRFWALEKIGCALITAGGPTRRDEWKRAIGEHRMSS